MDKNLAAIYKKIKLFDHLYIYKFVQVVEDVMYHVESGTIIYEKKGKKRELFDMEDLDFTISDDKYCFSDYITFDDLQTIYETTDVDEMKNRFKKDCCSFLRFGVFDMETEVLKIIDSNVENIETALPDSHIMNYQVISTSASKVNIVFSLETVNGIIKQLDEHNNEELKEKFESLLQIAEHYQEQTEEPEEQEFVIEKDTLKETQEIDISEQFNQMIGLSSVKNKFNQLKNFLLFSKQMESKIMLEAPNLNMVFMGNAGTGKTTVARMIAKLLYNLGYVKDNTFAELTAQDFVGGYVGQTAIKAKNVLTNNRGKVIFVDEAYVFNSDAQRFANEALVEILKEMENRESIFIFAGYKVEMIDFINMNPGLKSRIGYYIDFPDYTIEQLYQMFVNKVMRSNLLMAPDLENSIKSVISKFSKKEQFGNGRFIDKLFDSMLMSHANRTIGSENIEDLMTLSTLDIDEQLMEELEPKIKEKKIGY